MIGCLQSIFSDVLFLHFVQYLRSVRYQLTTQFYLDAIQYLSTNIEEVGGSTSVRIVAHFITACFTISYHSVYLNVVVALLFNDIFCYVPWHFIRGKCGHTGYCSNCQLISMSSNETKYILIQILIYIIWCLCICSSYTRIRRKSF